MKVVKVISLCGLLAVLTTGCSGSKEPSLVLNKTSLSLYQERTGDGWIPLPLLNCSDHLAKAYRCTKVCPLAHRQM